MSTQEERRTLYSVEDHIATITINRPPHNALTHKDIAELTELVTEADNDDNVRVMVLTGAGDRAFSVGGDIKTLFKKSIEARENAGVMDAQTHEELDLKGAEYLFKSTEESQKELLYMNLMKKHRNVGWVHNLLRSVHTPSIAAVNGDAVGLGCEIALCCDIRIASENARFGEAFVKLGVTPEMALFLLPRIVGLSKAYEMVLTGSLVDAAEAYRTGIVSKVVPQDQLMSTTMEMAARIASNPPAAVRIIKEGMRQFLNVPLEELHVFTRTAWQLLDRSDDFKEAVAAFTEKRKPVFTGKL
ncbi:enoyl-CoA hydratase/isomerase family protein [Povalibacter sp.]|uniref:enoyl-CoA hydratase/isomerase family protein n=1 Tax=Povalibacter sp. TaxID=1962978 RepID=UPI002F404F25